MCPFPGLDSFVSFMAPAPSILSWPPRLFPPLGSGSCLPFSSFLLLHGLASFFCWLFFSSSRAQLLSLQPGLCFFRFNQSSAFLPNSRAWLVSSVPGHYLLVLFQGCCHFSFSRAWLLFPVPGVGSFFPYQCWAPSWFWLLSAYIYFLPQLLTSVPALGSFVHLQDSAGLHSFWILISCRLRHHFKFP